MTSIGYLSPFVPPEWIAAHGIEPRWLCPRSDQGEPAALSKGVCPFAGAVLGMEVAGELSGLILATSCDQMRYVAAVLEQSDRKSVFLFNVPATWQTAVARRLYRDELGRLGRFMVRLGGVAPTPRQLAAVMHDHQRARQEWLAARPHISAREGYRSLLELRSRGPGRVNGYGRPTAAGGCRHTRNGGVALAVIGGPFLAGDEALFDLLEAAGGRVVLDGTEAGERTLPAAFDERRMAADPLDELATAYFDHIVDVFQRPNHRLYAWLAREVEARGIGGIVVRRYLWCDLWHAELHRLRESSSVAVLDLDAGPHEDAAHSRTATRVEAFLEVLR